MAGLATHMLVLGLVPPSLAHHLRTRQESLGPGTGAYRPPPDRPSVHRRVLLLPQMGQAPPPA